MRIHANATTTPAIRRQIGRGDISPRDARRAWGISYNTFYRWRNRADVSDRSSRPHQLHAKLSAEDTALVCSLYRTVQASSEFIRQVLGTRGVRVSVSTICRVLQRTGVRQEVRRQPKHTGRYPATAPGFVHVDVTYLPTIKGQKSYLYVAIDRATRLMYYAVYDRHRAAETIDFMRKMQRAFPFKVKTLLTDNGRDFVNRNLAAWLGTRGIEHRVTKPYSPWTNGMVERVNKTIKAEGLGAMRCTSARELRDTLGAFLDYYNRERVHLGLTKDYPGIDRPTPEKILREVWGMDYKPPE